MIRDPKAASVGRCSVFAMLEYLGMFRRFINLGNVKLTVENSDCQESVENTVSDTNRLSVIP